MPFSFFGKRAAPIPSGAGADLFSDGQCRVDGDPAEAGFGELYLPDRFRRLEGRARCWCRVESRNGQDFYLLVRVVASANASSNARLSITFNGTELGFKIVRGYGTQYFPVPRRAVVSKRNGWADVELKVLADDLSGSADLGLYELRLLDVARDDFPDRLAFGEKLGLFSSAGGKFYETLSSPSFSTRQRLLEIGSGEGHLACLVAAYSGASVTGIDVIGYDQAGGPTTRQRLAEEFRLHRTLLGKTERLRTMASDEGLSDVLRRTTFLTMNAERMDFASESFDFAYSINVMEHIRNPGRALSEIFRVLSPGGTAVLQYSPLYYSDSGSHLPPTLGFNKPWAQLLMTRDEIKLAILKDGGIPNEVDNILDSLNGCPPQVYYDAVETSGFSVLFHEAPRGFTMPAAINSSEFDELRKSHSEVDLTTHAMTWVLQKPT